MASTTAWRIAALAVFGEVWRRGGFVRVAVAGFA
jgi:hypothetical protein